MGKLYLTNFLILLCITYFNYIYSEPIFVYEHAMNGARGPLSEYKSLFNIITLYDEYRIHWDGDGELTLKGKMQHYILGIRNRFKYPNLLNYTELNPNEILIHTTNSTRVKESAYNQLQGMFTPLITNFSNLSKISKMTKSKKFFYPPNYNVWKYKTTSKYKKIINEAELSIQLAERMKNDAFNHTNNIDIKLIPFSKNRTFFKKGCLNHKKYINYNHRKNYKKIIKGFLEKKYGQQLQNFFGYQKKKWLYHIHRSFSIVDHYIVNYEEGRDLSYFLNSTGINKDEFYKSCKIVYEWWLFHIYCDKKTCVMESSKLMEDLIKYMDNKINNKTNELKMLIDFGEDVTVGPMQIFMYKAFDVDYTVCNFACNIFFELHKKLKKDNQERYFVRYYVDDDLRLNINYNEFKRTVLNNIWSQKDKDNFCRGSIMKVLHPTFFLSLYIILPIIFILICSFVIYKYYSIYISKKDMNNKKQKLLKENIEDAKELEAIK